MAGNLKSTHESPRALSPEVSPRRESTDPLLLGAVVSQQAGPDQLGVRRRSNLRPVPHGDNRKKTRERPRSGRENPPSTALSATMCTVQGLHGARLCGSITAVLRVTAEGRRRCHDVLRYGCFNHHPGCRRSRLATGRYRRGFTGCSETRCKTPSLSASSPFFFRLSVPLPPIVTAPSSPLP